MTVAAILILLAVCYVLDIFLEKPAPQASHTLWGRIHTAFYQWLRGDPRNPSPH